jgi:hypothetical protein
MEAEPTPEPTPKPITSGTDKKPVKPPLATRCVGPEGAKRRAVFLHGMQAFRGPTVTEVYGRDLERVAETTGTRIAVPESAAPCRGAAWKSCWTADSPAATARTWRAIVESAATCFDGARTFSLVGFSNGGYFAAKVAMLCDATRPSRILAIGSAGDAGNARLKSLAHCSPLTLSVGDRDGTRRDARAFAAALRPLGLPTRLETYRGGHEVPWARVSAWLAEGP